MKEWKVVLSPEFKEEFKGIFAYISNLLLAPETAKNQVERILERIEKLSEMPNRFPLTDREPWRSRGLRKMVVDNYVVFYYPNEQSGEVVVFHVFYGGRNIEEVLSR